MFINNNFSYHAGNGNNQVGTTASSTSSFLASVNGYESFGVGNGSNTVAVGTAPGGTVNFNGGNGINVFALDNSSVNGTTAQFYNFNAVFGNGPNTFAISDTGGGGTTASGSAFGGTGTNTFQQNQDAQIGSPWFLRNF